MVTGEYEQIFRIILVDKVNVLGNGVCCSAIDIETCIGFFTRRKYEDAAVTAVQTPVAGSGNIGVQLNRFILCKDTDNIDTAVRTVGKREVDDTVLSTV